jgi:hypothetical protein
MIRRRVLVTRGRLGPGVTHDLHYRFKIADFHPEPGTERVPQIEKIWIES